MSRRRSTAPPRAPAGPPADVETGVPALRLASVKLFQRDDGEAADWGLLVTCLFKLGFDLLEKLPEERRAALADRIHQRAFSYLATEAGKDDKDPLSDIKAEPPGKPAADAFNAPALRPR
jgi:hypothetical protein